jgi:hypothetical protein
MAGQEWKLNRPFRTAVRAGFAMAALLAVAFVLAPIPVWSYFGGLAYCLFLSLCVVGIILSGRRWVLWWLFSTLLPLSAMFGVWLIQVRSDPETFFRVLDRVRPALLAVVYIWLAVSAVAATVGWLRYIRSYWSESEAEPSAGADSARDSDSGSG